MTPTRTQITGLGPVMPDGSRQIFDKEPKPFIASAEWLKAQSADPAVGDFIDTSADGVMTLVPENPEAAAQVEASEAEAQKKTDGEEGSSAGLENSQSEGAPHDVQALLTQIQINSIFETRIARLEVYLQRQGHDITKYDGPIEAAPQPE